MFAEKAIQLIRELERTTDTLPPFNDEVVRQVLEEMKYLYDQNYQDVSANNDNEDMNYAGVQLRHAALERNKRCLLAYLYNRMKKIRQMRWEFGSVLPEDIKHNLCEPEFQWFLKYSKNLATYMRSIGDYHGLNLTQDMTPPKFLYIEVRCLVDYGKYELDDGEVIVLKKNSQYLLLRSQCEPLIRQGILQHIVN